jgi:hypothetical protein
MAYSSFSLKELSRRFDLEIQYHSVFDEIKPFEISPLLQTILAENRHVPMISEKAKSENIISPILRELLRHSQYSFSLFSGTTLDADQEQGLTGECDFIFANKPDLLYVLEAPIFTLIEAKKDDIEDGLGQCAAQMLGASIYNRKDGYPIETIFGCVTSGFEWLFLRLDEKHLNIDTQRYFLNEPEKILGILQAIVNFYKP